MKQKLTPWQKIVRAAIKHQGLRLTPKEVGELWMDDAICTRAANDDLNRNSYDDEPNSLKTANEPS